MNTLEPKPTEYKGVLFRSKSEAIFARALELSGFIWEYEPDDWTTSDGWTPDFFVAKKLGKRIGLALIEYKPAPVTDAYRDELAKRFNSLAVGDSLFCMILACGSAFNDTRQSFFLCNKPPLWNEKENVIRLFAKIDEAARFRFDLQHLAVV